MIVEDRGAKLSGQCEQLLHRLAGESLGFHEFRTQLRRCVLDRGLKAQRHSGQRLVDLIVKILGDPAALALLRADRRTSGLAAFGLEPGDHAVERVVEPLDLGAVDARRSRRDRLRLGQVDVLHRRDQSSRGSNRRCSSSQLPLSVAITASASTNISRPRNRLAKCASTRPAPRRARSRRPAAGSPPGLGREENGIAWPAGVAPLTTNVGHDSGPKDGVYTRYRPKRVCPIIPVQALPENFHGQGLRRQRLGLTAGRLLLGEGGAPRVFNLRSRGARYVAILPEVLNSDSNSGVSR